MKKNYFYLLFASLFFVANVAAQTNVPALITSNQVWNTAGSPYLINQNTYIDSGVSVLVMPGTVIKSNGQKLMVDGEFQAVGTINNRIFIDSLEINYSPKSNGYNPSTQKGAFFQFCDFVGLGSGRRSIYATSTSIRIDHCKFSNTYYAVYLLASSKPVSALVTHSDFSGDGSNYGYPLYTTGTNLSIVVEDNYFHDAYNLYIQGQIQFNRNTVNRLKAISFQLNNSANMSCNLFKNMSNGIQINLSSNNKPIDIIFTDNTLDSVGGKINGTSISYPMFKLYRSSATYTYNILKVSNNNFLTCVNCNEKVEIQGYNASPKTCDTLNFRFNYWGTTLSATIDSNIRDWDDDIMIFGKVDYTNFLSAPDTTCDLGVSSCPNTYEFTYTTNGKNLYVTNTSNGGKQYRIVWDFGDGHTDSNALNHSAHKYNESGTYVVCMTIYDDHGRYCGATCDTINMGSGSSCQAYFYVGIDTTNKFNLYILNGSTGTSSSTQYYWSFGDGTGSTAKNPTHKYNAFGLYNLCLTLYDSAKKCFSTYCDSIGLDSNGRLLKNAGFTIDVRDEKDVLNTKEMNAFSHIRAYPNPTQGIFNLNFTRVLNEMVEIKVYNSIGYEVFTQNIETFSGENQIKIDLSNCSKGMYFLRMKSGNQLVTVKVLKSDQ